jgi:hypothetical protein
MNSQEDEATIDDIDYELTKRPLYQTVHIWTGPEFRPELTHVLCWRCKLRFSEAVRSTPCLVYTPKEET